MTIYQIDSDLRALIDEDTGEINDFAEFERLCSLRGDKIEAMAIVVKQLFADEAAIDAEIKTLTKRRDAAHKSAERIKFALANALCGQPHKTPRVSIGWRKSEAVQIADETAFVEWAKINGDQYLKYKDPEISKSAIKDAIKAGVTVNGAWIEQKNNIQIK